MVRRLMPLDASHLARSLAIPFIVSLGPMLPVLASTAHAQVTQTPGAGSLNTQVNHVGNVYEITHGTQAGSNLFHSFGEFSVGAVETARFQTTTLSADATVGNILGRVTGGNTSNILGTIDSATYYPNANLFLMNPNGFLFGPNATVNVGGMATFTTAEYHAANRWRTFNASPNAIRTDLLTAAPVAAFGFIGSNPHAIDFKGGQLTVAQGTGITLLGGDINLVPDLSDAPSGITAPGRQIQLTSVAGTRRSGSGHGGAGTWDGLGHYYSGRRHCPLNRRRSFIQRWQRRFGFDPRGSVRSHRRPDSYGACYG